MPTTNLGRIGYVNKGNWAAGTYKRLDVVRHAGATWSCRAATTTTQEPSPSATDWMLLVQDGTGGAADDITFSPTGGISATDVQAAIAELDSEKLAKVGGIYQNLSAVRADKGTVSTGTVTFSLGDGNVQRLQVGGALTIALSGWPTAGNHAAIKLNIVNGGSAAITWPTVQWIQKDGTSTTNISTYLSNIGRNALQASGLDEFVLWSDDAGTTVRGKIL